MMSDLLRNLQGNLWVKTKHAIKFCVDLWEETIIPKEAKLVVNVSEMTIYGGFWLIKMLSEELSYV